VIKFIVVVSIFVIPLLGFVWVLVRWQNTKMVGHLRRIAQALDLEVRPGIGNALFEFPAVVGHLNGFPVWIGSVSGKRKDSGRRYISLRIVCGRRRGAPLASVGPHDVDEPNTSMSFASIERLLSGSLPADALSAARSGTLDGGHDIEVGSDALVRTFASTGVTSRGWERLAIASARVMAAYAQRAEVTAK
jgi:hypothetical protein